MKRSFVVKRIKQIVFGLGIFLFSYLVYFSRLHYLVWKGDKLSKYLLPPYNSINYFLFYVGMRYFAPYVLSLVFAMIFFWAASGLNKKSGEKFFEKEEIWFGAISIFLMSHPGWMIYLVFLISIYLLSHIGILIFKKEKNTRISLYYLWFGAGLFAILIIEYWLKFCFWWPLLKI